MEHNKSYFKKYENNHKDGKRIYDNDFDFIVEKTSNSNSNYYESNNNTCNMTLFQNKVEELFLKLKFLNSNKKISSIDISDCIGDIGKNIINNKIISIDNTNDNTNDNIDSSNIINLINEIIIKLDKKIISKGQINRNNNLIDFEF